MRVLVLSSTYPRWRGDTEPAFVHELTRRLAKKFDVAVIAPHAAGAKTYEEMDGVRISRYRYAPPALETLVNEGGILTNLRRFRWKWLLVPAFLVAQWWALRKAIRRYKPDVIHAHWLLPQGFIGAWASGHIPVLATSHGADLFGLRGAPFGWLRHNTIRRVASLSVVSSVMRQRIAGEVPGVRVEVLPMGVEAESTFFPDESRRTQDALLFVGRLVEKKGLIHLIQSMPAILEARPKATLTVIGFGPERENSERCVEELGLGDAVRFLGALPQSELPGHYRKVSLLVAPFVQAENGDQEGLGLVVAEAMACECPVVVGDVPGVRDLVDDSCGVIVNALSHRSLANAVIELLKDDDRRKRVAIAGRLRVLRHFAWSSIAEKYVELLQGVTAKES